MTRIRTSDLSDANLDAVFGAEFLRGIIRAHARRLKDGIALGFRDQPDDVGFLLRAGPQRQ